jgi:hypothetical protein
MIFDVRVAAEVRLFTRCGERAYAGFLMVEYHK